MKFVLTNFEKIICQSVPTGAENAVSQQFLEDVTGRKKRDIRRAIKAMREKGVLICSRYDKHGGYYFPANDEETAAYLGRQLSRLSHIWAALSPFKKYIKALPIEGQIALDEFSKGGE